VRVSRLSRAVRLVLDNEGQHASRRRAVTSIAAKIGCTPQTLNDPVPQVQWQTTELQVSFWKLWKLHNIRPIARVVRRQGLPRWTVAPAWFEWFAEGPLPVRELTHPGLK